MTAQLLYLVRRRRITTPIAEMMPTSFTRLIFFSTILIADDAERDIGLILQPISEP